MKTKHLDEESIDKIRAYSQRVIDTFASKFEAQGQRFASANKLIRRFSDATESVLSRGQVELAAMEEAHNELCVANELISAIPPYSLVEYEPLLKGCAKSIDFRATVEDKQMVYVDVKTIRPRALNRWDQFARAKREGWLAYNTDVVLSEPSFGGELWHYMVASRSRMLEYALDLESKISSASLTYPPDCFTLMLCGDDWHWSADELEDFVAFYRSGCHRSDDSLSAMELTNMKEKKRVLSGAITHFACL